MLKKLRLKFIWITMVIVTVMLFAIFGLILHFTSENLTQNNIKFMEMDGKGPGGPDKLAVPARSFRFSITQNSDGSLTIKGDLSDRFEDADYQSLWDAALRAKEHSGIIREYSLRYFRTPDRHGSAIEFMDISGQLAAMDALWRSSCVIAVFVWFAMLVASIFLANWAIRPVEQAWEQQRQFVSDASHELKTPLTVIITNAELLENPDYAAEHKQKSIGCILTMSRQMRHLVEDMLELARVDNGNVQTHFEKVNLSTAMSDGTLPFEALFFERELELNVQIEPNILVLGNENYLRQMVDILLDNAQKYAEAPGQVQLTLENRGKSALLRLETPGTPLSKEQRKKIFERFYRVDQARTRSGSYGLGLSIARQIVQNHKGKIWAAATDHSNVFFILLPTVN